MPPIGDFRLIWLAHHDTAPAFVGFIVTAFHFGIVALSHHLIAPRLSCGERA
ncbi:hypothetical protein [Dickeya oryzae]|uniref:hypothetical protein n=1 Tax=Dickeya oryzae TaxID=1240404 RepID=UPI001AEC9176|nr:hypothetical protein [Dickeya oryzae]MBP2847964.1 hypothetical protein [Dickeya oryzae]